MEVKNLYNRNSEEYWKFIISIDRNFLPALSERKGGIRAFVDKAYDKKGKIFVCEDEQRIAGSLSYWITTGMDMYVWLLANSPELKETYKGAKIITKLTKHGLCEERNSSLRNIICTTWHINYSAKKFYENLGLAEYKTIPNDMIRERITLGYKGDFNKIYQRVLK